MKPTNNTINAFPLEPRPNKISAGVEWLRAKIKAARAAWADFIEKSAKANAERKASYAVFAKSSWDKAKAARAEADKTAAEQIGQPRWDHYRSVAEDKTAAEVKAEIAYREAKTKASNAKAKAARITWNIAKADFSEAKNTATVDVARIFWEKAIRQTAWDKAAAEAVRVLDKATVAHTAAQKKEKTANDRWRHTIHLCNEAETSGFKAEIKVAKAEVETVTARNALDWAREEVAAARLAAKAASDPDAKSRAETDVAKAEAHVEVTMVAFARAKEKYALAKAGIKAADETQHAGFQPEVKAEKPDLIKVVWDHAETEAARVVAKAEVDLAEIVWARANAAAVQAVAQSELGNANPGI